MHRKHDPTIQRTTNSSDLPASSRIIATPEYVKAHGGRYDRPVSRRPRTDPDLVDAILHN